MLLHSGLLQDPRNLKHMRLVDFHESTNSHLFIEEQIHIIEEDDISYCKPVNHWKFQPLHVHPRKVDMELTKKYPPH